MALNLHPTNRLKSPRYRCDHQRTEATFDSRPCVGHSSVVDRVDEGFSGLAGLATDHPLLAVYGHLNDKYGFSQHAERLLAELNPNKRAKTKPRSTRAEKPPEVLCSVSGGQFARVRARGGETTSDVTQTVAGGGTGNPFKIALFRQSFWVT